MFFLELDRAFNSVATALLRTSPKMVFAPLALSWVTNSNYVIKRVSVGFTTMNELKRRTPIPLAAPVTT
jgi:hypothetical protein